MGEQKAPLILLLILCFILVSIPEFNVVKAEAQTIVVPDDYATIQEAIGNASEGDTVFVRSGTYEEHTLVINKTLSLVGEDANNTLIRNIDVWDWDFTIPIPPKPPVILIDTDNIIVSGFTIDQPIHFSIGDIRGRGDGTQIIGNIISIGDIVVSGSHQTITLNIINPRDYGISCDGSYNNITTNIISGPAGGGILIKGAFNNIYENIVTVDDSFFASLDVRGNENIVAMNNVTRGMAIGGLENSVFQNRIAHGGFLISGYNNTFYANYATYGVSIGNRVTDAANNTFYHNNFVADTKIEIREGVYGPNFWDNGVEGNYWNDYNGTDVDGDGIGDTPYSINENNQDNYPLMAPIKTFDAGTWEWTQYNVDIISNSTVSDFRFNPEGALIKYVVTGENGTTGFCRVTIPKDLLYT
jgi:nitrous oxidase accessory protein